MIQEAENEMKEDEALIRTLNKITYKDFQQILQFLNSDGLYDRKLGGGWEYMFKALDSVVDKHMFRVQAMEKYLVDKDD